MLEVDDVVLQSLPSSQLLAVEVELDDLVGPSHSYDPLWVVVPVNEPTTLSTCTRHAL